MILPKDMHDMQHIHDFLSFVSEDAPDSLIEFLSDQLIAFENIYLLERQEV